MAAKKGGGKIAWVDPVVAARARLVLVTGAEAVLRQRALSGVLAAVGADDDGFDLETFDGDGAAPAQWFASAGTAPFLADRRTVVVRHLLRCDAEAIKTAPDPDRLPPSALVVLVADDEGGSEDKIRRLETQAGKWAAWVQGSGGTVIGCDADSNRLRDELRDLAAARGKKIGTPALDALSEMCALNLSRSIEELEKLTLYVGASDTIRESDVRAVVVPSREWSVYKLVDSIVEGKVPDALRQLRDLIALQAKPEEAAFSRIFPTISRQLRLMYQNRAEREARDGEEVYAPKTDLRREPDFRRRSLDRLRDRADLPRLARLLELLADADARLKGQMDGYSARETLERMVLEMASVAENRARPGR